MVIADVIRGWLRFGTLGRHRGVGSRDGSEVIRDYSPTGRAGCAKAGVGRRARKPKKKPER